MGTMDPIRITFDDGSNDTTIDAYCPFCGHRDDYPLADWECSIKPESIRIDDREVALRFITGIPCTACGYVGRPSEWHRARERKVMAAKGFITPRMMKEAQVSA